MPFVPVIPPQPVPVYSGFDYVTVDAQRRRVYAAHTGSRALLVVDADSGKVVGQVRVGPLHGIAVDPATGHVYTGDGEARTVSEVDPVAMKVVGSADVDGIVDAVAYDPGNGHIYADEDDGTRIFVVDAHTMKSVGTVALPGHKPEYLAVDPQTHDVYQNIATDNAFVVVDGTTLTVKRTVPTPELKANHPLQYDAVLHHVLVGGANGVLSVYDRSGTLLHSVQMQSGVDQCSLDETSHTLACAGSGEVALIRDDAHTAPVVVARAPVPSGVHTVGVDSKTGNVWVVWGSRDPAAPGDFVQAFALKPSP
jgi:outer membrane protein assembly factor BamB